MSIYSELILDHYQNPRNYGKISNPTNTVEVVNPLCGDKIKMGLVMKDNKIIDIKFEGIGCAISKAASSMLTEYAKDKTKDELQKLDKNFMIKLLGIELGVNRVKCGMLPSEALKKLIVINKDG